VDVERKDAERGAAGDPRRPTPPERKKRIVAKTPSTPAAALTIRPARTGSRTALITPAVSVQKSGG
jgi:hypothetical protein